ncbi:MAG: hypothetical protein ACI8XU_000707 [Kiritimatiellia bacterium]|jgi:hypothetical protein
MRIWNFICGSPKTNLSRCEFRGIRLRRTLQIYSGRALLFACVTGALSNTHAAENEQIEDVPDLEFLEFLGQFETDAGEWIDPDSLLTEGFTELLDASSEADSDDSSSSDSSNTDDATNDNQ